MASRKRGNKKTASSIDETWGIFQGDRKRKRKGGKVLHGGKGKGRSGERERESFQMRWGMSGEVGGILLGGGGGEIR